MYLSNLSRTPRGKKISVRSAQRTYKPLSQPRKPDRNLLGNHNPPFVKHRPGCSDFNVGSCPQRKIEHEKGVLDSSMLTSQLTAFPLPSYGRRVRDRSLPKNSPKRFCDQAEHNETCRLLFPTRATKMMMSFHPRVAFRVRQGIVIYTRSLARDVRARARFMEESGFDSRSPTPNATLLSVQTRAHGPHPIHWSFSNVTAVAKHRSQPL